MVGQKDPRATLALAGVVALLISGCATEAQPVAGPTSSERVFTDPDCGTFGIVESAADLGADSRREVIQVSIEGQRDLIESPPDLNTVGFTPKDAILALEAALEALPDIEREADPDETVIVPAVDESGAYLGEFVIRSQNGKYVFDTILIAHEDGIPCPTE